MERRGDPAGVIAGLRRVTLEGQKTTVAASGPVSLRARVQSFDDPAVDCLRLSGMQKHVRTEHPGTLL